MNKLYFHSAGYLRNVLTFGCPRVGSDSFYGSLLELTDVRGVMIRQYRMGHFGNHKFLPDPITRTTLYKAFGSQTFKVFNVNVEC